jgi:DnaJ-class molecular chaperone
MTSLQTDCFKCQGKGWVYVRNNFDPTGGDVVPDSCWDCGGTGKEPVKDQETLEQINNAGAIK